MPSHTHILARSESLADRLAALLLNLATIAAAFMPRSAAHHLAAVQARIIRASFALQRRLAWLRAGHLPSPATPADSPRAPRTGHRTPSPLPLAHGWLSHLLGHYAATYATYLEQELATPEMQRLMGQDPKLALILRPVRRMFGIMPKAPRRPPAPRPPRPAAPPIVHRSIDPPRLDRNGNPRPPSWLLPRRRRPAGGAPAPPPRSAKEKTSL